MYHQVAVRAGVRVQKGERGVVLRKAAAKISPSFLKLLTMPNGGTLQNPRERHIDSLPNACATMRAVKGVRRVRLVSLLFHDAFVVDVGPFRDVGSLMCMEEEASYMYRALQDLNQNNL